MAIKSNLLQGQVIKPCTKMGQAEADVKAQRKRQVKCKQGLSRQSFFFILTANTLIKVLFVLRRIFCKYSANKKEREITQVKLRQDQRRRQFEYDYQ